VDHSSGGIPPEQEREHGFTETDNPDYRKNLPILPARVEGFVDHIANARKESVEGCVGRPNGHTE